MFTVKSCRFPLDQSLSLINGESFKIQSKIGTLWQFYRRTQFIHNHSIFVFPGMTSLTFTTVFGCMASNSDFIWDTLECLYVKVNFLNFWMAILCFFYICSWQFAQLTWNNKTRGGHFLLNRWNSSLRPFPLTILYNIDKRNIFLLPFNVSKAKFAWDSYFSTTLPWRISSLNIYLK